MLRVKAKPRAKTSRMRQVIVTISFCYIDIYCCGTVVRLYLLLNLQFYTILFLLHLFTKIIRRYLAHNSNTLLRHINLHCPS